MAIARTTHRAPRAMVREFCPAHEAVSRVPGVLHPTAVQNVKMRSHTKEA